MGHQPPSIQPSYRRCARRQNDRWERRHEGFVAIAKRGGVDVLFLGDSITDFWRNRGSNVWNKYYAPRQAANFGISGDRTEHVLWRIDHGELDGIKPKVVVLMIGTNNTGKEKDGKPRNTVPEVIAGVTAVVRDIRTRLPDSKVLLLGIFPRGNLDDLQRAQVALINTVIAKIGRREDGEVSGHRPEFSRGRWHAAQEHYAGSAPSQ